MKRIVLSIVISFMSIILSLTIFSVNFNDQKGSELPVYYHPEPCSSKIYCYGKLLHTIQLAKLFRDSKEFVDMKLKKPEREILKSFDLMMNKLDKGQNPSIEKLREFVELNFDPPGSEFEEWTPADWKREPKFLRDISNDQIKLFASTLNDIWRTLGRKMTDHVRMNEHLYSIIYVENPVIVPGGRFREFYYWDSYWIIKGLLVSEMTTTVKGMLDNFLSIINRIGFIPNGGRIYYSLRSQPPMLLPMVKLYIDATHDYKWLQKNLWLLEKEFHFWLESRTVDIKKNGRTYRLARYVVNSSGPRPESYSEDYESGKVFSNNEQRDAYYMELKSAAESGWDFSSRWFISNGTNQGKLQNLNTRSIVPVDLNAILYKNAMILSEFNHLLKNRAKGVYFQAIAEEWKVSVTEILWDDETGTWLDYDLINNIKRNYFYPSNILPLWTNCYDPELSKYFITKVLDYLKDTPILDHVGGIPTTLEYSGEQWDFPNAWPPLQYFVIQSLENTESILAKNLAFKLSQTWLQSNYQAFNSTLSMFEKYDATISGAGGGGGEYEVQLGFGWTNGVVLDIINKYKNRLTID